MNELNTLEGLWAGTDASHSFAAAAMVKIDAYMMSEPSSDAPDVPYSFELQGSVGVISIRGPLVNCKYGVYVPWASHCTR